jgi:hypothetical protein
MSLADLPVLLVQEIVLLLEHPYDKVNLYMVSRPLKEIIETFDFVREEFRLCQGSRGGWGAYLPAVQIMRNIFLQIVSGSRGDPRLMGPNLARHYLEAGTVNRIVMWALRAGNIGFLEELLQEGKVTNERISNLITAKEDDFIPELRTLQWLLDKKIYQDSESTQLNKLLWGLLRNRYFDCINCLLEMFPEVWWWAVVGEGSKHVLKMITQNHETWKDMEYRARVLDVYLKCAKSTKYHLNGITKFDEPLGNIIKLAIRHVYVELLDVLFIHGMSIYQILCERCVKRPKCESHLLARNSPILFLTRGGQLQKMIDYLALPFLNPQLVRKKDVSRRPSYVYLSGYCSPAD